MARAARLTVLTKRTPIPKPGMIGILFLITAQDLLCNRREQKVLPGEILRSAALHSRMTPYGVRPVANKSPPRPDSTRRGLSSSSVSEGSRAGMALQRCRAAMEKTVTKTESPEGRGWGPHPRVKRESENFFCILFVKRLRGWGRVPSAQVGYGWFFRNRSF